MVCLGLSGFFYAKPDLLMVCRKIETQNHDSSRVIMNFQPWYSMDRSSFKRVARSVF
jgi:hypothetical protein